MAKRKKEELDLYEITGDYEVLSEEIVDGKKIAKLRTHSGHTVICDIPIHTEEEEQEIMSNLCRAMIRIAFPGIDTDRVPYMRVDLK